MKLYIYKVHSKNEDQENDMTYIGSTTLKPIKRFQLHVSMFKRRIKGYGFYCSSFQIFEKYGIDGSTFSILEEIDCDERKEQKLLEYDWMYRVDHCINILRGKTLIDITKYNREYKRALGNYICEYCRSELKINSKSAHNQTKKHKKHIHNNIYKEIEDVICNQ